MRRFLQYRQTTLWNSTSPTNASKTCKRARRRLGGIFDYPLKAERLEEVERELERPSIWDNPEEATKLGQERAALASVVQGLDDIRQGLQDAFDLIELAEAEDDEATVNAALEDVGRIEHRIEDLEFRRMFSGELDPNNAFLDIQAGSGSTEAQDWASMLLRMYLRWGEARGFKTELIEESPGDVAGIKSATIEFTGEYAYGWLRTEIGVHRLVRKSPFDSGNRRHTSFAAVFVSPEIDDNIEIEINPADLRVDVYRASGAGGQHVNRTESAVRITHLPTNIVVQSQNSRSQHENRSTCMKQLRDQSRIKDLRTGYETSNTQAVLDGGLDPFLQASLKQGVEV